MNVAIVRDDPSVLAGDFERSQIDVGDLENAAPELRSRLILHELYEQHAKQVLGQDIDEAHAGAINAENQRGEGDRRNTPTPPPILAADGSRIFENAFQYVRGHSEFIFVSVTIRPDGSTTFRYRLSLDGVTMAVNDITLPD